MYFSGMYYLKDEDGIIGQLPGQVSEAGGFVSKSCLLSGAPGKLDGGVEAVEYSERLSLEEYLELCPKMPDRDVQKYVLATKFLEDSVREAYKNISDDLELSGSIEKIEKELARSRHSTIPMTKFEKLRINSNTKKIFTYGDFGNNIVTCYIYPKPKKNVAKKPAPKKKRIAKIRKIVLKKEKKAKKDD